MLIPGFVRSFSCGVVPIHVPLCIPWGPSRAQSSSKHCEQAQMWGRWCVCLRKAQSAGYGVIGDTISLDILEEKNKNNGSV